MGDMLEVLVASFDSEHCQILATILGHCGLMSMFCSNLKEAQILLGRESIRLVFCEQQLTDGSFRDMLQATSNVRPDLPVVVFSRRDDSKLRSEAIQLGASDCIGPPFHHRQIEGIVHKALVSRCRPELATGEVSAKGTAPIRTGFDLSNDGKECDKR